MSKLSEIIKYSGYEDMDIIYSDCLKEWAREQIKELEEKKEYIDDGKYVVINWIKENILEEEP